MSRCGCKTMPRPAIAAAVLIFISFTSPAHAEVDDAVAVVARLHATLLSVMEEADTLGVKGRDRHLAPEIERAFHLRLMARITSGAVWMKADTAQRDSLAAAFSRLSIATYASRFQGYSGQSFETIGGRPGPAATHLVDTRILRPGESPIPLTYVLKQVDGRWGIVDILLDTGISELAVRRSEYRSILKKDGLDGLIAVFNAKVDELLTP
jgi:phospholipid transport system substrate-binding protein